MTYPVRFGDMPGRSGFVEFCSTDFLGQVQDGCEDSLLNAAWNRFFTFFGLGNSPFRHILGIVVALCGGMVFSSFLFSFSSMAALLGCFRWRLSTSPRRWIFHAGRDLWADYDGWHGSTMTQQIYQCGWLMLTAWFRSMMAIPRFGLVSSPRRWPCDVFFDSWTTYAERHVGFSTKQRVRKDRNRTNGRRTLTLYLYLCILGLTWTGCHASEDEQTRQSLQQRRLAMTLQATPATGLAQRWHVFEQTYGLRRPPPGGHYDAAISRPQDELREVGHSYGIRIHFAAEPHGIETLIVQHWADVRREVSPHNQWRLHPMHDSAYASAYFPSSHRHYLLTMEWERHCRPNKRPIAVEVVWHHERGTESALARPWMIKDEPTVSFLEEMHLLQACTTSHRCHIFHNGAPYEFSWMNLSPGDYVKIEAYKVEPPHDTDSEGELPMPIATADREESSSWTSSSTSTSTAEVDELHLENAFMSEALLIYRPLGRTPRPHYLIQEQTW